jgi:hypothetical protein
MKVYQIKFGNIEFISYICIYQIGEGGDLY